MGTSTTMRRMPSLALSRRRVTQGLVAVLAARLLPFPGRATLADEESLDLVRFAWLSDVGTLTPFQISTAGPGGAVLLSLIYDTLTWKDER